MKFATTIRGPGGARAGCAALIAVALLTFGCPARAADAEVTIDNFTFSPQTLTIKAGTKVTWMNRDDIPHAVTSTTKRSNRRRSTPTTATHSPSRPPAAMTTFAHCIRT
jgi:plastocyanin